MGFRFTVFLGVICFALSTSASAMQVDPELLTKLRRNSNEKLTVLAHLNGEVDLSTVEKLRVSPQAKAKILVRELEQQTLKGSEQLVKLLKSPHIKGVDEITYLWITNSVKIKASAPVIEKLLSLNGIESLMLDTPRESAELFDSARASMAPDETPAVQEKISWGVEKVKATDLWKTGIDGSGIVVAVIDSGANLEHPDLKPNFWKNPGETGIDANGKDKATNGVDDDSNGYIDDVLGWNFEDKNNNPKDENGHGSQTAGIVGGAGTGGTKTGVAPKAKLMILRSCCNTPTQIFESNTWEAMQYAVKNGARVISMSLSAKHPSKPSYAKWRRASEVLLTAGVVHINSAGNRGSDYVPNNIGAPASNPPPWFHPKQEFTSAPTSIITIGATDAEDALRDYSSTGPVTWESIEEYKDFAYDKGNKTGLIKPDVCGPSEIPSTAMTGKGYTADFGGTSSATPVIGGVVALLLQAKPTLTVAQVLETLQMSAVKVESEFNNKCGAGRVDALAAVEYAKAHF